jgi:hypothetical protein
MEKQGTRLGAQVVFYGDQVEIYAARYRDGKTFYGKSIVFEEGQEGLPFEPILRLPMSAAQEFFEQLWAQGFRSKHDRGGADKLDAARSEHIADLRKAAKLA